MNIKDIFSLAYRTIRSNKIRTRITIAIIAMGIAALILIITIIESMNASLRESFSTMGTNAFNIRFKESRGVQFGKRDVSKTVKGRKQKRSNLDKRIDEADAEAFKNNFKYPALASIYLRGPNSREAVYGNKKTNPNVTVWGGDENYILVNGYALAAGRNFSKQDVQSGRNVCLLGSNTASTLFGKNPENSIDKVIRVGGKPYLVVGLLKSKGSSAMLRQDDVIITTYKNAKALPFAATSFLIGVKVDDLNQMDDAIGEASSVFRSIRRLNPTEEDNFVIEKSDKFAETFISMLGSIQGSAGAIGLITLIGAAIGLMNIMLVAVNERTREVGLIKAIGGKKSSIRWQFLLESMIISLFGAVWGIGSGVLLGNILSMALKMESVMPWFWVITGIIICSVVGLLAGVYPAYKASKLDPIVALRYE